MFRADTQYVYNDPNNLFYQSLFINHCVKTSVHMCSTCCNGKFYDMLWSANSKTQLLLASPLEITRIYFWKNIAYDVKASNLHRMSTFSWNCNKADLILIFLKKKGAYHTDVRLLTGTCRADQQLKLRTKFLVITKHLIEFLYKILCFPRIGEIF